MVIKSRQIDFYFFCAFKRISRHLFALVSDVLVFKASFLKCLPA